MKITSKEAAEIVLNGGDVLVYAANGAKLDARSMSIRNYETGKTKYLDFGGNWKDMDLMFYKAVMFDAKQWIENNDSFPMVDKRFGLSNEFWSVFGYYPEYSGNILNHGDMIK